MRRLILQATGYCNIDCAYCYLPDRSDRRVMPVEVVAGAARLLADSGLLADELEVRWHAGEPLTAPIEFYERAYEVLTEILGPHTALRFSLQTNGIPITDAWCELFRRQGMEVGVSIDGPAELHDANRRNRAGKGTHRRVVRGIERLRAHGIPFDVISVITPATMRRVPEYLAFLTDLAPRSVGLNPEETEGEHRSGLLSAPGFLARYRRFLAAMYGWQASTGIPVRRFAAMRSHVLHGPSPVRNDQVEPLMILSVDVAGRASTFSPELLGQSAPGYDDFVLTDVRAPGASLTAWSPAFTRLAADVAEGTRRCAEICGYFALCGGGAAANKWHENGSFASTTTGACQLNTIAVADVVLAALEVEHADLAAA